MSGVLPRIRALLHGGWSIWSVLWLATLASALLAVLALSSMASESFELALESVLAERVADQAGLVAAAVESVPLESVTLLDGRRSMARLQVELENLRTGASLHDLALLGPQGVLLSPRGATVWVVAEADQSLIEEAAAGAARVGPLYHAADGDLFQAAYAPIQGHPGWVVAVEGSGSSLQTADRIERSMRNLSGVVLVLSALLGALLAAAVARPIHRLGVELAQTAPGSPPEAITEGWLRETRIVGGAARRLLAAVRERDQELRAGRDRELRQVTALAAAVAHEVRNPLNALSLSVDRLGAGEDRAPLRRRLHEQIGEIDQIVARFLDLSRPPLPSFATVDLGPVLDDLRAEANAEGLELEIPLAIEPIRTDPALLRQALRNLVRNSIEAGAQRAQLRVSRTAPLHLYFSDEGPGLEGREGEELFDWFFTTRAQGSGLGLPSARRALRAVGGEIELACSRPATFRIILPGGVS